jgi:hypothetical protein
MCSYFPTACCTSPAGGVMSPASPPPAPASPSAPDTSLLPTVPTQPEQPPPPPKSPLLILLEARLASHTELHHAHGETRQLAAAKGRVGRPHPSPEGVAASLTSVAASPASARSLEASPSSPAPSNARGLSASPFPALVLPLLPAAAESPAPVDNTIVSADSPESAAADVMISGDSASAARASAPEEKGPTAVEAALVPLQVAAFSDQTTATAASAAAAESACGEATTAADTTSEHATSPTSPVSAPVLITCVISDAGALGLAIENKRVGGGSVVRKVLAGGLVEAAGLRVGDAFERINEEVVRDSNFIQVQNVLKSAARPLQIIVARPAA